MSKSITLPRRDFIKLASKLAFPIMVQNLISTLVNVADTTMLGNVSQTAMSASSLANQFTFVLYCFFYGMATGTSVLCGQYYGKGDVDTTEKVTALAIRLAVVISVISFAISFFFAGPVMRLFSNEAATIAAGEEYLRVISFSYLFMGISQVYMSSLRSIGKVVIPSITYVVSLSVNVFFNAAFIFGLFGLPRLGVTGVALGTVIARAVEVAICFVYSTWFCELKIRIKYLFSSMGVLMGDFMKLSVPAVANDLIWGLASSVFAMILGHIGDDMVAANAVAVMVVNIGAIACRGFANATTIIVSQELGQNNTDNAKIYGKRMLNITIVVSLVGCAVIMAIRPFIMHYYSDKMTETAIRYLGYLMIMTTWRLVGEGINTCLICGCFRGGGDSRFGMIIDTVFMWLVAIPLMAAAAYIFKLPPLIVYLVMSLDEFYKMPVVVHHFKKNKWMKNITRDFVH